MFVRFAWFVVNVLFFRAGCWRLLLLTAAFEVFVVGEGFVYFVFAYDDE